MGEGHVSFSDEVYCASDGLVLSCFGRVVNSDGHVSQSFGRVLNSDWLAHGSDGRVYRSDGRVYGSNGLVYESDGACKRCEKRFFDEIMQKRSGCNKFYGTV